ncbi:hypothetical protein V6N13_073054 [Hibiscus sabdariffa]|uniref:Protein root UVB sensitive/RUS domain-containing protein n=1 Tax=Hibiscus sabdariffa TaxID=183260 RepID=A0ABR2E7Y9_9ROSI
MNISSCIFFAQVLARFRGEKAVGVGSFSGTATSASATVIRWVSKDGFGTVGLLFIGGRFGNLFDDDPKQEVWEATAQLLGLSIGILIMDTPSLVKSYPMLVSTWASMQLFHL